MSNNKHRKNTLMQLQVSLPVKLLVSSAVMAVLILMVYLIHIPNPNMILIAGLVLCSALFGYGGGIVSAVIMLFYTLFFFSVDHSMIFYTQENLIKVIVSVIGITADMLFVCALKTAEVEAFREVDELTVKLQQENEMLHVISLTDALTGIRNRLALRKDYDGYLHREVNVMMLDLDKFKEINDNCGHEEGDMVLKESAAILIKAFGAEHCYRYGGDEFLVIVPDMTEEEFREKIEKDMQDRPRLSAAGKSIAVDFSYGYVHHRHEKHEDLREMLAVADERMYKTKRSKKQ